MSQEAIREALALGAAAFVIGLSGAMAPGPYLTVTVSRTLRDGKLSAFLMLAGHALLEGILLVGFAFGLQNFLKRPTVASAMALIGGAVLLWMGYSLMRGAYTGAIVADLEAAEKPKSVGPVLDGILVSLSNPYWTLWWATIGVKLAADGLAIGPVGVVAFFVGHQLADIAWYGFVIFAVSAGRGLLSNKLYRGIMAVLATFLLYLGASFVWEGLPWS